MSVRQGSYQWEITDPTLINKILNAANGKQFESDVFRIGEINWRIYIKPNGSRKDQIGSFQVYLKLVTLPLSWKSIIINRSIQSPQTRSSHTDIATYNESGKANGWPPNTLRLQEMKEAKFHKLIFVVQIKIFRIILKENGKILYHYKFNWIKHQKIIWNLDKKILRNAKKIYNGKGFESKIFNNMWCMALCPNGHKTKYNGKCIVFLRLCAFPLNVSAVDIQWNLSIPQINFKQTKTKKYSIGKSGGISMFVGSFNDFLKVKEMEMMIDVLILKEYDSNNKEIEVKSMENEEEKQDFMDNANIQESEKRKEAVKLSQKENKVSAWLKKTVSKPEYIQNFIDAGFDTMAGIEDMDETDLREIGIQLKGHRRHILKHIKQIQTETDEKEDRPRCLSNNAGVVCIAISKYDKNTTLHSLPDVKDDVERYKNVLGDGYNYTIMSSLDEKEYENGRMTASDVKKFINKCYAEIIVYDETDYSLSSKFDALFITVSGHGTATSLVCSDNSKIKYNKIRQKFSHDEELEAIPRIYCIDACRVFDDEVKPGRDGPSGAFSVTIMGNTEGEIVRGGKVSKFMMRHFQNAKASAKWMNFQQILENAQRDMKNDKTTDQILILTEYDMNVNKVVFKPHSGGRGSKYKY